VNTDFVEAIHCQATETVDISKEDTDDLTAEEAPLLADLWDNEEDSVYNDA
jgi:hypothetical protein